MFTADAPQSRRECIASGESDGVPSARDSDGDGITSAVLMPDRFDPIRRSTAARRRTRTTTELVTCRPCRSIRPALQRTRSDARDADQLESA